jgi:hypothetical protein
MLGFKTFYNARRVLIGIELMQRFTNASMTSSQSEYVRSCNRTLRDGFSSVVTLPSEAVWNLPINVREAAGFLGVSQQTVYLWVERKQIPYLRV